MAVKLLALSGGAEYLPENEAVDRAFLKLTRSSYPSLVIVPAAAAAHARRTVKGGLHHFARLGAESGSTMVTDELTADDPARSLTIENADAIYLADGNPLDAVQVLKDSAALRMIARSWERGAVVGACAASAMAICEFYWDGGVWEPGLGLVKNLAVLPHHQVVAGRFSYARLSKGLSPETHIIGIEDGTGVMIEGQNARVVGSGAVTVYYPDGEKEYLDKETFTLGSLPA